MEKQPWLQRVGMRYVARRDQRFPATETQADPYRLDEREHRVLLRLQWTLVIEATLLGAGSGLLCALAELWGEANLAPDPSAGWTGQLRLWGVIGAITMTVSLIEVLLLHVQSLKAVQAIARTTGTRLTAGDSDEHSSPMSAALVRAALELPNPPPKDYAIDPLREVARWRVVLIGLLYKAKIGLTSFIIKMLLQRVAGRAVLRVWLVFVGVPVTAFWNGMASWIVIREARLRAIGPSAARRFAQMLDLPRGTARSSSDDARADLVWRAVASTVVRTHQLHPNVHEFMAVLEAEIGPPPDEDLDDTARFLTQLVAAPVEDQRLALRALSVAAILDGKVSGDERRLVDESAAATGLSLPRHAIRQLRSRFVGGGALDAGLLAAIASGDPDHRPNSTV